MLNEVSQKRVEKIVTLMMLALMTIYEKLLDVFVTENFLDVHLGVEVN